MTDVISILNSLASHRDFRQSNFGQQSDVFHYSQRLDASRQASKTSETAVQRALEKLRREFGVSAEEAAGGGGGNKANTTRR